MLNLKRKVSNYKIYEGYNWKVKLYRPRATNTFFFFGIELAQMKLDELVEDVMNLDINKESMVDNRGHSQD